MTTSDAKLARAAFLASEAVMLRDLNRLAAEMLAKIDAGQDRSTVAAEYRQKLDQAILDGRTRARDASFKALRQNLPEAPRSNSTAEDRKFAASTAASLADQLRQFGSVDPSSARQTDVDAVMYRAAVTESAQAFSNERHKATNAVASMPGFAGKVLKRWDVKFELGTCDDCFEHDGELAPLGTPFKYGDVPGAMHPHCRCVLTIVPAGAKKMSLSETKLDDGELGPDDVHEDGDVSEEAPPKKKRRMRGKGLRMRLDLAGGHQVEIRHGADQGEEVKLHDHVVELTEFGSTDPKLVWIQVAKCGHFEGHAAGAFELNPQRFDEMVRNFTAVDLENVAFDFEHASEADEAQGSIPSEGAPACGWIRKLDNRGQQGLFALVEWLEPAKSYIKEKRYKFVSPAIRFNARHPQTGERIGARLTSCALTNKPFLRGMMPVAAKDSSVAMKSALRSSLVDHAGFLRQCCGALGMSDTALPADMKDKIGQLRKHYENASDPRGQSPFGLSLGQYTDALHGLAKSGGGSPETVDDLLEWVESRIDAAIKHHEAEFHGMTDSSDPEDQKPSAMADSNKETVMAMTDEEKKSLKDAQDLAGDVARKLRDAESKNTELSLQLKAAETKTEKLEGEIKALKDAEEKRLDAEQASEVDAVIESLGEEKGINASDKPALLSFLKANPEGFRKLYPVVPVTQRYLHAKLTADAAGPERTAMVPHGNLPNPSGNSVSLSEDEELDDARETQRLVDKYVREGATLEDACIKASRRVAERGN